MALGAADTTRGEKNGVLPQNTRCALPDRSPPRHASIKSTTCVCLKCSSLINERDQSQYRPALSASQGPPPPSHKRLSFANCPSVLTLCKHLRSALRPLVLKKKETNIQTNPPVAASAEEATGADKGKTWRRRRAETEGTFPFQSGPI